MHSVICRGSDVRSPRLVVTLPCLYPAVYSQIRFYVPHHRTLKVKSSVLVRLLIRVFGLCYPQIDILVGEPIPVVDLLAAARNEGWPADRLHTAVAARVAHGLKDLRHRLDARSAGLPDPGPSAPEPPSTASSVSSLDQFDPTDLTLAAELRAARRWGGGGSVSGGVSGTWERLKSRMALQHRTWATQSMPAVSASVAASAGGALAARPSGTAGAMSPPLRGAIAATCGSVVMAPDCAERLTAGGLGLGAGGWSLPPLREFLGMGMGPRWCPEAAVSGRSSASGHWSGGLSAGRSIEAVIMA